MTISGPTSALSSFLREHGITRIPSRWQRANREEQTLETTNEGNESNADDTEPLDNENQQMTLPPATTTTSDVAAGTFTVNRRMVRSATVKKSKKKPTKKRSRKDDDNYNDECHGGSSSDSDNGNENNDNQPAAPIGKRQTDQQGGQTACCTRCNSVFYFPSVQSEPPSLCPTCIRLSTVKQAAANASGRRKRASNLKRPEDVTLVDLANHTGVPSLHDLCINLISKYIEHVESLGDISDQSRDRLCLILAKHRQLNDQTIQLFFDARNNTSLKLFDCARLTEAGLESIAFFNPRLQELLMKECGRLNDAIVERFAFNLTNLRSVTLCGAYLITDSAFAGLVKALAEQLVSLHVENSPKLAGQTLLELGSSRCRRLERLSLRNCTALSDQHVIDSGIFGGNCRLTELDFAHSVALTEQAFSAGLPGQTLRRFCLDGCHRIGDSLFDQIASHCPNLEDLSIEGVVVRPSEERSKAIGNLLSALPRLRRLNCGQNLAMDCTQLARVCSEKLTALCLNGMRQLVDLGQLKALINRLSDDADCVDLSWIPAMNDDCLELVMQRCADGCKLYVYGCTGLTDIAFDYWRKHRPTVSCFGSPFL